MAPIEQEARIHERKQNNWFNSSLEPYMRLCNPTGLQQGVCSCKIVVSAFKGSGPFGENRYQAMRCFASVLATF